MPVSLIVRSAPFVLAAALGIAACGDDDEASDTSAASPVTEAATVTSAVAGSASIPVAGTAPTGTGGAEVSEYCQAVRAFEEITASFDATDVQTALDTFGAAASAARDVADVAPAEVREAHDQLAGASEQLLEGLREADPRTIDELNTASEELLPGVEASFGDLQDETDQVEAYTAAECGVS